MSSFEMNRRFHERIPADFDAVVTELKNHENAASGRVADISKAGISILLPRLFAPNEFVQLEMADSKLFGRVAYVNPEGRLFRTGIEVERVLLGGTDLSQILQGMLVEAMGHTPGVHPSDIYLG